MQHFIEQASKKPLLTADQEKVLARRIESGDHSARQELVERNVRLAVSQARRYQHSGVEFEDLVQEALIGIDRAAEKFDWRKGHKFSTYAMWWIRHMMQRAVHKNRATIRIPGHIAERKRKLDKYLRENPDGNLADAAVDVECTLEQAMDAMSTTRVVASLDQPFADDEGGDRYATIADDSVPDPSDISSDEFPFVSEAMAKLDPIQRQVIRLRFGFDGPVKSRDEVANELGVRPHVVQRAQRAALAALEADLGGTIPLEEEAT